MSEILSITPKVTVKKGYHGWEAGTYFQLKGDRVLRVTTMKRNNGKVTTSASSVILKKDGIFVSESFVMFQDFSKTLLSVSINRVTEKSLTEAHNKALENIDAVIKEAKEFYSIVD